MSLLSLTLRLRPLPQPDPTAVLPIWWGRAAHRLLLDTVEAIDPPLVRELHDEDGPRPFSVSSLLGRFPHGTLEAGGVYRLRFTALTPGLRQAMEQAAASGPLAPGAQVELDRHPFEVLPPETDGDEAQPPQSGDPQSLSAPYLLGKIPAPRRLGFTLLSPTTFKSGGKHVPVPLPELVFGSLLERWNAFAPLVFPPEARRYAAECLAMARYDLHTRSVVVKGGGLRVGAVGEVSYITLNYDRYWMSVLATLAEYAWYAGVGAGVTNGLGQCRRKDVGEE